MKITEPFLFHFLESMKKEIQSSLHAAMPGNLLSYDPDTGLASVQPALCRKNLSGEILTAPILSDVPVLLPSADYTPTVGDPCILLFMDFCLDGWLKTAQPGQPALPPSPRTHDLSDAVALVGFFPACSFSS